MRKKFASSIMSGFLCLLLLFCTYSSVFALEGSTQDYEVKVNVILEGELPEDADEELISILIDSGWVITGNQMSKRTEGRGLSLVINDEEIVEIDHNGLAEVPNVSEGEIVEFNIDGLATMSSRVSNKEITTLEVKLNFDEFIDGMGIHENEHEHEHEHTSEEISQDHNHDENIGETSGHDGKTTWGQVNGKRPAHGHQVHCNRFNGYNGDGKYWSSQTSSAALKNFAWSDCDVAFALWVAACALDYSPTASLRYCAGEPSSKRGKCSAWGDLNPAASHSKTFHMHTSKNAPRN